jgi:hypothetical protein
MFLAITGGCMEPGDKGAEDGAEDGRQGSRSRGVELGKEGLREHQTPAHENTTPPLNYPPNPMNILA